MRTVIKVENLSKSYVLRHQQSAAYSTLRETIAHKTKGVFSKSNSTVSGTELFWALNDVSFEVKQGDRVGIIGRNGAGKSTLLKLLSRITEPTSGRISLKGRVASLLEVGTGFHPELTGRENIFLNGSILGMSKAEIKSKFDEIVAFAEVERFLDTPVKRYSSGMYVRLAFAVAAHLEPEILIVDEVLAVGDAQFQKKCIGKMQDVSSSDRTLLFVSHNIAAIQNLCTKVLYLKDGKLQMKGDTENVIKEYLRATPEVLSINLAERKDRFGNGLIRFESIELKDEDGHNSRVLQCGKGGSMRLNFIRKNGEKVNDLRVAVGIDNEFGQRIAHFSNETTNQVFTNVEASSIEIAFSRLPISQGRYTVVLYSTVNNEVADWIQDAGIIEVEAGDFFKTGKLIPSGQGNVFIDHSFRLT